MKRRSVSLKLTFAETVLVPLEILHFAFVLFGGFARLESAEIAALAGPGIDLARIEPVFAGFQFADH
ncbi:hypothetical protein MPLA_1350016 [Mesorhizobium sp. ORS 3359]|nr:hypothetical protein MPLA_1350016 [Mesorhizobium sp. ORS 3359]